MNCAKKLLTFLLVTVLLVMSMASQVLATDITISGGAANAKYEAYKLLHATDGGEGRFSYTLNEKYADILKAASGKNTQSEIVEYISNLDADGIRDFADAVYTAIKAADPAITAEYATSNDKFADVNQGYYLIAETTLGDTSDTYSLVMLDTAGQEDLVVNTKEGKPVVEKKVLNVNETTGISVWGDVADSDMGDAVNFKITGTVADKYADYATYYYSFVDTMEKGLTYNGDAKVFVVNGSSTVDVTAQFTIVASQNAVTNLPDGFTAAADLKQLTGVQISATTKIVVEYTATLNDHAVIGTTGNQNAVYLEYENDPYSTGVSRTRALTKPATLSRTPVDVNIVFTYEAVVNKIDKNGDPLNGAGFTLYKWIKDGVSTENGKVDGWVAMGDEITGVTTFQYPGLDAGKYKLVESTVPDGYNKCDDIAFEIVANFNTEVDPVALTELKVLDNLGFCISEGEAASFAADVNTGKITTSIVNLSGTKLPGTGGVGTTMFYIFGGVLVLGAVVLLVTKRRMASDNEEK